MSEEGKVVQQELGVVEGGHLDIVVTEEVDIHKFCINVMTTDTLERREKVMGNKSREYVGHDQRTDQFCLQRDHSLYSWGHLRLLLLYFSMGTVWRDLGCQVTPHRVNQLPTNRAEEQRQVDRGNKFLGCGGGVKTCSPLVTHLKVL